MRRWREGAVLVGLLSVMGCGSPAMCEDDCDDAGPARDASAEDGGDGSDAGGEVRDGGGTDAGGRDAGLADAGLDAGRRDGGPPDAGSDAGPPPECDPIAQTGCGAGETCRVTRFVELPGGGSMWMTVPAFCDASGILPEHWDGGSSCFSSDGSHQDLCGEGLYCNFAILSVTCVHLCDPSGPPCPDFWSASRAMWLEQQCNVPSVGPPYCGCGTGRCTR